jgi:hypothetical protein
MWWRRWGGTNCPFEAPGGTIIAETAATDKAHDYLPVVCAHLCSVPLLHMLTGLWCDRDHDSNLPIERTFGFGGRGGGQRNRGGRSRETGRVVLKRESDVETREREFFVGERYSRCTVLQSVSEALV